MITGLLHLRTGPAILLYVIIDILCVGAGMGVPIFCIGFGFLVGWYLAQRIDLSFKPVGILIRLLRGGVVTSSFTLLMMALLWGRIVVMLWDPKADLAHFGIPMILYQPKASFIGWLVLMVLLSPFLQLLTTVFASCVTLIFRWKNDSADSAPM